MTDTSDDLSINIEGTNCPILCGTCKTQITFIGEGNAESGKAGCVSCGNIAEVQEIAAMAIEYAKDELQLTLNRALRDTARKGKMMTFKGKTAHDKIHRFLVDI